MTVSDVDLSGMIQPLVRQAFKDFEIDNVDVKSDTDHDGDPVVSVRIRLKSTERRYHPDVTFALASGIIDILNKAGDARFPLIAVYYASEEPDEDFYPEKRARRAGRG